MALDYKAEYQRYRRYYTSLSPIVRNPVVRAWLSLTASFLTVAIFLAFAIRPTVATIVGLVKEIADKKELSKRLDMKINSLASLQSDYRAIESEIPRVMAALPADPDLGTAVIWVEKVAVSSGINPATVSISKVKYPGDNLATRSVRQTIPITMVKYPGDNLATRSVRQTIPITIGFEGSYDQVTNFLNTVYQIPRIFAVSQIDLGLGNQTPNLKEDIYGRNAAQLPVKALITAYFQQ